MRKYMMEKVAAGTHRSMVKMEVAPGFYEMDSGGLCQRGAQNGARGEHAAPQSGIFWRHDPQMPLAHGLPGCAELCRLFCGADDVTYGGLSKIGFSRTKALSNGEDGCEFLFYRK